MFNEELKNRFIESRDRSESVKKYCVSLFNAIEKYEVEWGRDICTKQAADIDEIISDIIGIRKSTSKNRTIILEEYCSWCLKNNVDGACDGLLHASWNSLDRMKECMVSSPMHLQKILDALFESEDENAVSLTYRMYLWLAFMGVSEKDAMKITSDDINMASMSITFEGCEYPIYRESITTIMKCMTMRDFVYKHPLYEPMIRPRYAGNEILRGFRSSPKVLGIRGRVSEIVANYVNAGGLGQISYSRIWMSGLFYRAFEVERSGAEYDFIEAAKILMKDKKYSTDKNHTLLSKQKGVANGLKIDYNRWKEAFNA